jgi:hypothetical protein
MHSDRLDLRAAPTIFTRRPTVLASMVIYVSNGCILILPSLVRKSEKILPPSEVCNHVTATNHVKVVCHTFSSGKFYPIDGPIVDAGI